jgi:hypothetical protein
MKLDLPAVDQREKVAPHERNHHRAKANYQHGHDGNDRLPPKQHRQELRISAAQPLEAAIECGREPCEQASRRPLIRVAAFALEQQADRDRRQRPRQAVGSQHREHDGQSQRREQILGRSIEEQDRGKDAADGERRHQRGYRDLGGAVQRRLRERHPLLGPQPVGILDRYRRVIDQYAHSQGKAAEGHRVQRLAEEIQHDERRQDCQRD